MTPTLDAPFAIGHTAEVYAWEDGTILKLFRDWFPLSAIEHEAHMGQVVHEAGLNVPAVIGNILEINGRYGLIYERINGTAMLEVLTKQPWKLNQFARLLAELQAKTHEIQGLAGLPSQHEKLRKNIETSEKLSPDIQEAVLNILEQLPPGKQLCHGDFHSDNVLITQNGPVIIDWIDASNGNPLGDIARSSILMSKGILPEDKSMRWLLNLFRNQFHRAYLKRIFQLHTIDQDEFNKWLIVIAAARLSEGIPEEQELLAFVRTNLP